MLIWCELECGNYVQRVLEASKGYWGVSFCSAACASNVIYLIAPYGLGVEVLERHVLGIPLREAHYDVVSFKGLPWNIEILGI